VPSSRTRRRSRSGSSATHQRPDRHRQGPDEAIRIAARPARLHASEDTRYSDSAYYLLGIVAERATGQTYGQLLQDRFFTPFGLDSTSLGAERWSAGGVQTTVTDLVTWAPVFWGGGLGVDVAAEATRLDPHNNFGIGTFGFCPARSRRPSTVPSSRPPLR
jgi:CubicO group peptidase (beta-lactamase class C family)